MCFGGASEYTIRIGMSVPDSSIRHGLQYLLMSCRNPAGQIKDMCCCCLVRWVSS
jgi:hypothetical protein